MHKLFLFNNNSIQFRFMHTSVMYSCIVSVKVTVIIVSVKVTVLITDVSDSKLLEASTGGGDGNCIADEDQGSETGSDLYGSWVS